MGRSGKTLRQLWQEKGYSEEEIERRWQARIEKTRAVKRRNYLRRMGFEAETLGLEEDHGLALKIEKYRKELLEDISRVRKISPRKGMRSPTSLAKEAAKRSRKAEKRLQRELNPRFLTKGVPGLTPDADGKIALQEAKRQRPDLFDASRHVTREAGIARNRERKRNEQQPD